MSVYDSVNDTKSTTFATVNEIEDLASYSQSGAISLESTTSTLTLKTNGLARLTIENDGDIGIGLADPSGKLDVAGSINVSGSFKINGTEVPIVTTTSDINVNTITAGTSVGKAKIGSLHSNGWAAFANSARFANGQYALRHGSNGETVLNSGAPPVVISPYIAFRIQNYGKMRLMANGNFGIGLNNPSQKLEVLGNIKSGASSGKAVIGSLHGNAWAAFANSAKFSDGNYALIQHSSGVTFF